ncbi:MAG: hypothetical protein ABIR34_03800, partial [Marmoricola sp.]
MPADEIPYDASANDEVEPTGGSEDPTERPAEEEHDDSGLDLARSIAWGLAGKTPQRSSRPSPARTDAARRWRTAREGRSSGAYPDDRDPQTMDATLGRFVSEQGWETELRVHGV